jgi:hypothetical protein
MNAPEAIQEAQPDVLPIENMDQFVQILTAWHGERCAVVQQLLEVPEGSEFQVGDAPSLVLAGSMLDAFKLGIEMTMMQLGELPFVAETEDHPTPPADAAG